MPDVQVLTSGTSRNLDAYIPYSQNSPKTYSLPETKRFKDIVGIGIAGSDDHVYVWYEDGTVSSGYSQDFEHYLAPQSYSLPPGKKYQDIVGIAIAGSTDHVYAWYKDGTVSSGTSRNLDKYQQPQSFSLPPGKHASDIVDIAIAGSTDHVYVWYKDGTVSSGTSRNLDHYQEPQAYSLAPSLQIADIVGIAIAGSNDHVYVWYKNLVHGLGPVKLRNEVDDLVLEYMKQKEIPGMTVAISKDGKGLLTRGYGYSHLANNKAMTKDHRSPIGSVSKMITAFSWMKLTESRPGLSEQTPVYGSKGVLKNSSYLNAAQKGVDRFTPIVGMAIAGSNDHVYVWYDNGMVSSGTSSDLDKHTSLNSYSLPPGKTPMDIRSIAIAGSNDHVYVWYDDGSLSSGTSRNLDQYFYEEYQKNDAGKVVKGYKAPMRIHRIMGIAIAGSNDRVYVWYENGTVSSGTSRDFTAHFSQKPCSLPPGKQPYDIRDIAIAGDDHVYVWYIDGTVSSGTSTDLDKYRAPYPYSIPNQVKPAHDWMQWYRSMTVAHLLTHSAGFVRSGDTWGAVTMFDLDEDEDNLSYEYYEEVHKYILRTQKLKFSPGSQYSYSNHGMGLVGHLVETAANQPFHEYATDNILKPAVVSNSTTGIIPYLKTVSAFDSAAHYYNENGTIRTEDLTATNNVRVTLSAGGWTSSAGDLVKLLLATDQVTNHSDVLQPSTLQKMEKPYWNNILHRGLGWGVSQKADGSIKVSHGGDRGESAAFMAKFLPDYQSNDGLDLGGINIAICANIDFPGGSSSLGSLANDIVKRVATADINANFDIWGGL